MRNALAAYSVWVLAALSFHCAAAGTDRPAMFRGNAQLTGVYATPALHSISGVKFAFATGGAIRSTPAVAAGIVYFGSSDGTFYALDAQSGRERWHLRTGGAVTSSPAIAEGVVFFASRDGFLYALDASSGRLRWRLRTGKDIGEQNYWDYYLSSPIIYRRRLFVAGGDGVVRALDPRSGKVRWTVALGARIRATPAVSGDTVVIATMSGHVIALGANDGAQRWKFATRGAANTFADKGNDTTSISASPSIGDGVVVAGGRDGFAYGINLADGTLRWRTTHDGSSWILASAIEGGTVYLASGSASIVQAADLMTGAEKWRHATGGAVFSSISIAGDVLYFADLAGNVEAIDKATGARRWIYPLADRAFATPVVADGVVYCGSDDGTLIALEGSTQAGTLSPAPRRIVYWEGKRSDKAFSWFQNGVDTALLNYLKSAGYEQLGAGELPGFLAEQIALRTRSVVVFADNRIPASVVSEPNSSALIRRYLDAGGKVVLLGTNPLALRTDSATGALEDVDFTIAQDVFGLQFPRPETIGGYYASQPTGEGRRWGLRAASVGSGGVVPREVTTVLALDEFGMASAWVKNYGGTEGTGLLQLSLPRLAPGEFARYRPVIEHGL